MEWFGRVWYGMVCTMEQNDFLKPPAGSISKSHLASIGQVVIDSNWRAKAELRALPGHGNYVCCCSFTVMSVKLCHVVEFCFKFALVRLGLGKVTDFGLAKKLYTASHFSQLLGMLVYSESCAKERNGSCTHLRSCANWVRAAHRYHMQIIIPNTGAAIQKNLAPGSRRLPLGQGS